MNKVTGWSDGFLEGWGLAIEAAVSIARQEGTHPELNIANGGPDWYKHGQRIADRIQELNPPVRGGS